MCGANFGLSQILFESTGDLSFRSLAAADHVLPHPSPEESTQFDIRLPCPEESFFELSGSK
jgi:hypothetical protein